jgi:hypothetical protein
MIKALLLVLSPAATWDRIVLAKRNWLVILLMYLLPLWVLAAAAEAYGLAHWGKPRGELSQMSTFSHSTALIFEVLQLLLMLGIVLVSGRLIEAVGETFHGRHTFNQGFTVAAYGLAPFFAIRVLDMFPAISTWVYWVTWVIGMFLCIGNLYHGIPKVMQPDPPQAFGVYVASSVLLLLLTGLARFLTFWYLDGRFQKLDMLISQLIEHVPFLKSFDQMHILK